MAGLQDLRAQANFAAVEPKTKGLRTTITPRGIGFSVSGTSGTIAAAQAAGSCFWAIRHSPTATLPLFMERMRFCYTTISSYTTTTPVSGRRLSLFRGSGAATTGGTALVLSQKDTSTTVPMIASGGDLRIASTGALGISSITWESGPIREMSIAHLSTAGGYNEEVYDLTNSPDVLQPGQVFGIRCPIAMDAGGTFLVSVDVDAYEAASWNSTSVET